MFLWWVFSSLEHWAPETRGGAERFTPQSDKAANPQEVVLLGERGEYLPADCLWNLQSCVSYALFQLNGHLSRFSDLPVTPQPKHLLASRGDR